MACICGCFAVLVVKKSETTRIRLQAPGISSQRELADGPINRNMARVRLEEGSQQPPQQNEGLEGCQQGVCGENHHDGKHLDDNTRNANHFLTVKESVERKVIEPKGRWLDEGSRVENARNEETWKQHGRRVGWTADGSEDEGGKEEGGKEEGRKGERGKGEEEGTREKGAEDRGTVKDGGKEGTEEEWKEDGRKGEKGKNEEAKELGANVKMDKSMQKVREAGKQYTIDSNRGPDPPVMGRGADRVVPVSSGESNSDVRDSRLPTDGSEAENSTAPTRPGVADHIYENESYDFGVKRVIAGNHTGMVPHFSWRMRCTTWLQYMDRIHYKRNFSRDPVTINNADEDPEDHCPVGCRRVGKERQGGPTESNQMAEVTIVSELKLPEDENYGFAVYKAPRPPKVEPIDLDQARAMGFAAVMNTRLDSEVPSSIFSWSRYGFLNPPEAKNARADVAAFLDDCNTESFNFAAIKALTLAGVTIHSYGKCMNNMPAPGGRNDTVQTLKRYKFCLAFENMITEDYVSDSFFDCLAAGSVPIVIGYDTIASYAPSKKAYLQLRTLAGVPRIVTIMHTLQQSPDKYLAMVSWKGYRPNEPFLALIDLTALTATCRLCIFLATKIREDEELDAEFNPPCSCKEMVRTGNHSSDASARPRSQTVFHLFVRERGAFDFLDIFLRDDELTVEQLHNAIQTLYSSLNYKPSWKSSRPPVMIPNRPLKVYTVYPLGMTQRDVLYGNASLATAERVRQFVYSVPCGKLEVILM
ncbi:hypothetical protein CBR_g40329 [Chara braunii]|uniref:Fucosyltransferase n=1 Tax=Chara braunii TaxID=69332 RepID=A0A388LTK6_CHABU|nr:hypothetical protein CBR_g40329 [Chara braunii]|eukprot:GBG85601.1 hypothetical protein CBR_g40329 [Chara braunii]